MTIQHHALDFIRVTEAAARACHPWFGKGDKNKADAAAVTAMRNVCNTLDFDGTVVIGEGEKDEAPMLYHGEKLGTGNGPRVAIAVDPLECTSNLAQGKPNSISVLAAAPEGCLRTFPGTYVDHLCVGPQAHGAIDITRPVKDNLKMIAAALNKSVDELRVVVLDRERHQNLIKEIRDTGARVSLIDHGTIVAGIAPALPNSTSDVLVGMGGAPEAVIVAAALRALGGDMQAVLKPHNEKTKEDAHAMGYTDPDQVFSITELAKGDDLLFAATGISSGPLLRGITKTAHHLITHSVMLSTARGVQYVETHHALNQNEEDE